MSVLPCVPMPVTMKLSFLGQEGIQTHAQLEALAVEVEVVRFLDGAVCECYAV